MNAHTKPTHTHTLSLTNTLSTHLSMLLLLNNISKSKTLEASPPVHISPDSRSSELERRSRSIDRDLSRSLPLAVSAEGELSLSSQSLYSALSSRHPSPHLSWDSERSLSRVWDDLSLEDLRKNQSNRIFNFCKGLLCRQSAYCVPTEHHASLSYSGC